MLKPSNTPKSCDVDKLLEHSNIEDMLETTNASVAQIAIEYLDRMTSAKGITREALAKQLGIARQTLASRFNKRSMSLEDFCTTAQAIDLNPAEILDRATKLATPTLPAAIKETLQGDRPFAAF